MDLLNKIHCAILEPLWIHTVMMADNSQNSSSLMDCTNSTIYRLNGSECENSNELNDSTNLTDSSHGSSIRVTDSSHTLEDFPGFSQGDSSPDTEMKDPF